MKTIATYKKVLLIVAMALFLITPVCSTATQIGIWLTTAEIMNLPASGPGWDSLVSYANTNVDLATVNIGNIDDYSEVYAVAKALVGIRTGNQTLIGQARSIVMAAVGTGNSSTDDSLGPARHLAPLVIAADLVGLDPTQDAQFRAWLVTVRSQLFTDGRSIITDDERRPNNYGSMAGASRVAIDIYLNDQTDLARAIQVFKGKLGDTASYKYADGDFGGPDNDLSWQVGTSNFTPLLPVGATIQGYNVDGALPEEMRRGDVFQWPPVVTTYPWQALQGSFVQAEILHRIGYDSYNWSDKALLRACKFVYNLGDQFDTGWCPYDPNHPTSGTAQWLPWIINSAYHTNYFAPANANPGKVMGWTQWTHYRAPHTITATSDQNGAISPAGACTVYYDQTFTITANTGYQIANVLVDGLSVGAVSSYTFTNVTVNHTIAASFVITSPTPYSLNIIAQNGSVTKSPDQATYDYGSVVTLTATPNAGYNFVNWTGDLSGNTNPATITMNANKTVTANFAVITYTITSSAGPNGAISPLGAVAVNSGSNQTFTVTANTGYYISDVLVDGASAGAVATYTFNNVTANHTISASFAINTYTLTIISTNGTVSKSPDKVNYNSGDIVTLTATPNAGYSFVSWSGDVTGATNPATVTMSGNKTVTANFAIKTYAIAASAGSNGTITPSGTVTVNYGASQTFIMVPNTGYHVAKVSVDGVSVGAVSSYTFNNITAKHTISVSFAINTYKITATAGSYGSISPSGTVTVNYGTTKIFTITPKNRHVILNVVVDGVSHGPVKSYSFVNITANHTISATFK